MAQTQTPGESKLGNLIRMARIDADLTQKSLGAALGTNQSSVAAWESGKVTPRLEVLIAIAHVLNVDSHALVDAAEADMADTLAELPHAP